MDSEIIATLIHENEQGNIKIETLNKEVQTLTKEIDTLNKEIQALCQDLRTLNQDNKELSQENKYLSKENQELSEENELIKRKLADEEEISIVLSKRIELVEQDFRRYVEKMQLYLSYKKSNEKQIEERLIDNEYNDEIVYEKPKLCRSTNIHEWINDDMIYSLEI
jgi:chromosome segregation ATPase